MKTETQIAEENIKEDNWTSSEHKQSCQRFLEFLEEIKKGQQKWLTYQLLLLTSKITDLKQAIKLYEDNRI